MLYLSAFKTAFMKHTHLKYGWMFAFSYGIFIFISLVNQETQKMRVVFADLKFWETLAIILMDRQRARVWAG